jgi:flagellar biosynthesis protein FlhF
MHMKSFFAPTMAEAMKLVRFEMGARSIIVASSDENDGAVITAAIEDTSENGLKKFEEIPDLSKEDTVNVIRQSLTFHGAPIALSERLTTNATNMNADTPTLALAEAMDEAFSFNPISMLLTAKTRTQNAPHILIMGPPGTGKTITAAKLAALSAVNKVTPQVITTDCKRAGGTEQLAALTRNLNINLLSIDDPEGLILLLEGIRKDTPILIDSQGVNPFDDQEMDHLKSLASVAGAENVLVLAAGGDALEGAEIAREFSLIGATRLVVTRLDMTRRLGSILAAADAGKLSLSDISINPDVADSINPINPISLARLIMMYPDNQKTWHSTLTSRSQTMTEATL